MIEEFHKQSGKAGGAEVVFVYEASGLGFGLYDELTAAGITCHVLAPAHIARSSKQKREKTDDRDAQQLFELLRGHTIAGNKLPTVWIPDPLTRDDRETVRARLDVGEKAAQIKAQIRCHLKRCAVTPPAGLGIGWTAGFVRWLWRLAHGTETPETNTGFGARISLETLLHQVEMLNREIMVLDEEVESLSLTKQYAPSARAITGLIGVGTLTAMVFLTEMGDLGRFKNRRQIASYLGLAPSSNESGKASDRKGHITRQGSARVRKVLCQAIWSRLAHDEATRSAHTALTQNNPKRRKLAVVALMRRLAILMWHRASDAGPARDGRPELDSGNLPVERQSREEGEKQGATKRPITEPLAPGLCLN